MTHPLVNAFQGYHELVDAYDRSESIAEKGFLGRFGKAREAWILELMASTFVPEIFVGFYRRRFPLGFYVLQWDNTFSVLYSRRFFPDM